MKTKQVKKMKEPFRRYCYWIAEREKIRLAKERGEPKPWTDDEILQSYRFCNVRRMDDKVSQWLVKNWYKPNYSHKNMLLACALARFINKPESLAIIGFPKNWSPSTIKHKLRKHRDAGNTVFNGAYMVRGNEGEDKIECVVDYYVTPLKKVKVSTRFMKDAWETVSDCFGFGSFMAGQVVADLRWATEGAWVDRLYWAPMGPGSARGMNRIHGRDLEFPLKQEQFLDELLGLTDKAQQELPESLTNRLEMIDWQNCLCEFDKMERTLWEGRRPKARYQGV